ncbi:MAG: DUF5667 domain-containing protein [bacterium]|nr:DUF5667 domain-containing protein [bacterium]
MKEQFDENQINEMINRVKQHGDVSLWKKSRILAPLLTLITKLNSLPKIHVPNDGLERVKNQIFQRIQLLETKPVQTEISWYMIILHALPKTLKITGGVIASLLILISLTVGVSVAALESVPGQSIYPLKKTVEKIQLNLAADETRKTDLHIKFAQNRLDELEQVLEKNNAGELSQKNAQKIVSQAVKDLQLSTNAVVAATKSSEQDPDVSALTKLVELGNKQETLLESASINSEGEIKLELEQALKISRISKEEAIENIERAGLKIEDQPITLQEKITEPNKVKATGKLTSVTANSVSIGSAKFLLTSKTVYINIQAIDLETDQVVDIIGEIRGEETIALTIILEKKNENPDLILSPLPEQTPDSETSAE